MHNDRANAANVLEGSLDLIRQVLIKHETAAIAEFRTIIEAKNHELKLIYAERDALERELRGVMGQRAAAIRHGDVVSGETQVNQGTFGSEKP